MRSVVSRGDEGLRRVERLSLRQLRFGVEASQGLRQFLRDDAFVEARRERRFVTGGLSHATGNYGG